MTATDEDYTLELLTLVSRGQTLGGSICGMWKMGAVVMAVVIDSQGALRYRIHQPEELSEVEILEWISHIPANCAVVASVLVSSCVFNDGLRRLCRIWVTGVGIGTNLINQSTAVCAKQGLIANWQPDPATHPPKAVMLAAREVMRRQWDDYIHKARGNVA